MVNDTAAPEKRSTRLLRARLQRFSLRTKVVVPMVVLSTLPVVTVGLFSVSSMREALHDRLIARIEFDTAAKAASLETFLQALHRDLRVLSQIGEIKALAAAAADGRAEPLAAARREAERELAIFGQGRGGYQRLRYLNGRAEEILRLDMADGRPVPVAADELSREAETHYLDTAFKLEAGEVYISQLAVGETGDSSAPGQPPLLSCATPVAWDTPDDRGLLVVDVDPAYMFSLIGELPAGTDAWLVNHEGIYLGYMGDSPENRSLYAMSAGRHLDADFTPEEVRVLQRGAAENRTLEGPASVLSFASVQFDAELAAQSWLLLIAHPTGPTLAPVRRMTRLLWLLIGGSVVLAGLTGLFVASYVLRPVTALRRATVEIARGDLSRKVAVSTGDEIEALAADFNTMTERLRAAQEKLAGWNDELKSEVARQTDGLRRLQTGLARADKLASIGQMAASVMHEIGNPLAALKTKIQVAEEGELCKECEALLPELTSEVDRLAQVLRSFSRLGRLGGEKFEAVALEDVVDGVTTLVSADLRRRGVSLVTETEDGIPLIRGEPDRLRQLLINFILNAADASSEGGEIHVGLRHAGGDEAHGPDRVIITVRDHGAGISPEDLLRVWDPLFTSKEDGTGLGLAICRQIVTDHGGTVAIESELGQGTVVTVSFPAAAARDPAAAARA